MTQESQIQTKLKILQQLKSRFERIEKQASYKTRNRLVIQIQRKEEPNFRIEKTEQCSLHENPIAYQLTNNSGIQIGSESTLSLKVSASLERDRNYEDMQTIQNLTKVGVISRNQKLNLKRFNNTPSTQSSISSQQSPMKSGTTSMNIRLKVLQGNSNASNSLMSSASDKSEVNTISVQNLIKKKITNRIIPRIPPLRFKQQQQSLQQPTQPQPLLIPAMDQAQNSQNARNKSQFFQQSRNHQNLQKHSKLQSWSGQPDQIPFSSFKAIGQDQFSIDSSSTLCYSRLLISERQREMSQSRTENNQQVVSKQLLEQDQDQNDSYQALENIDEEELSPLCNEQDNSFFYELKVSVAPHSQQPEKQTDIVFPTQIRNNQKQINAKLKKEVLAQHIEKLRQMKRQIDKNESMPNKMKMPRNLRHINNKVLPQLQLNQDLSHIQTFQNDQKQTHPTKLPCLSIKGSYKC